MKGMERAPPPPLRNRGAASLLDGSLQAYLSVHGASARDSARLYIGYGASIFAKILVPRSYTCVGATVPGSATLTVSVSGLRVRVRPGTNDLDLLVHHEPETRSWFRVQPGDVVVDVGAHIGLYALLAAPHASQVIALEPDPESFQLLRDNLALNEFTNVRAIQAAASERAGWVELIPAEGPNRGTTSIRPFPHPDPSSDPGKALIRCDTLDRWLEPFGLGWIDWLKIDVEGHEAQVLAGASETLAKTRHLVLEVMAGHEDECFHIVEAAGLQPAGGEPGYPASNWFFERRP